MQTGWANAVIEAAGIILGAGYVYLTYRDRYFRYKNDSDMLEVLTRLDAKGGLDLHALELKKHNAHPYDVEMLKGCAVCGLSISAPDADKHLVKNQIVRLGTVCEGGVGKKCPRVPHFHPTCKECGGSFLMAPANVKL